MTKIRGGSEAFVGMVMCKLQDLALKFGHTAKNVDSFLKCPDVSCLWDCAF